MSNRTVISLMIILAIVFAVVKLDLVTKIKLNVSNWIYGEEIKNIAALRVVVERLPSDLETAGLTRDAVRAAIESLLTRNKVRVLSEEELKKNPSTPTFNAVIHAVKTEDGLFQYNVTFSITIDEGKGQDAMVEKQKIIWVTSGMGQGSPDDIRSKIAEEVALFLKAREN